METRYHIKKRGRNRKASRVGKKPKTNNTMKKSMKLFAVVILLTMATTSFAQKFGVKGGLNLSNILMKDDEGTYSDDYKMNPGFHIGATAEFSLSEIAAFETGLLLSTKGFKSSEKETFGGETFESKITANLLYLHIPLTAKAYFNVGGAKVYGALGPYIGMGLSGKTKSEETIDGETESEEEDVEWGSDEEQDDIKRLDYGLTAGAGVEINSILIGVSYDFGLANISSNKQGGTKISNRVLGISVGYSFGGK